MFLEVLNNLVDFFVIEKFSSYPAWLFFWTGCFWTWSFYRCFNFFHCVLSLRFLPFSFLFNFFLDFFVGTLLSIIFILFIGFHLNLILYFWFNCFLDILLNFLFCFLLFLYIFFFSFLNFLPNLLLNLNFIDLFLINRFWLLSCFLLLLFWLSWNILDKLHDAFIVITLRYCLNVLWI